jgi:hypothetical protein
MQRQGEGKPSQTHGLPPSDRFIGFDLHREQWCREGGWQEQRIASQATYERVVQCAPAMRCPHVINCAPRPSRLDLADQRRSEAIAPFPPKSYHTPS